MTNQSSKGKTLPKQNGSRRSNDYKRKLKNSSAFTRSKVASPKIAKIKVKSSPLKKISQKSKIIKKTSKPVMKKKSDAKSQEVVDLQKEIALMKKKIKLAEDAQLNAKKDAVKTKATKSKQMVKGKSKEVNSAVKNVSKKPKHAKNLKASRRGVTLDKMPLTTSSSLNKLPREVLREMLVRSKRTPNNDGIKKTRVFSVEPSKTAPKQEGDN